MEKIKLYLLFIVMVLIVVNADAQVKKTMQRVTRPATYDIPAPKLEVAQMRTPGAPVVKAPKKVEYHHAYYNRPAGMYPGSMFMEPDGSSSGIAFAPYFATKPYVPYTFVAIYDAETPNTVYEWDFQYHEGNGEAASETIEGRKVDYSFGYGLDSVPVLRVMDSGKMYDYFLQGNYQGQKYASHIMSAPNASAVLSDVDEGGAILVSSKNFCWGGFQNDHDVPFTYYSGIDPYGNNESGFWFGKNGGTVTNSETGAKRIVRIDGIAQAFEKPSHPYLLKRVVLDASEIEVLDQVDMTCKIYKIDGGIPAYIPGDEVVLPEIPGELVATGRATLTPETGEFIIFTLYDEHDGLEVEYTPTIEDDILVVIDGYNDEGMENLKNFSAMISSDTNHDEGFGELAYLKYGLNNDDGTFSGDYVWAGLNNFFTSGDMMTGLSIFLDIENPFLIFTYGQENGEYTFPAEGGLMRKALYDDGQQILMTESIEFFSWVPSVDDGWTLTCNGDDVPDWLSIELTDGKKNGKFNNEVNAKVVAEPLPEGVAYREAVVRFAFPGAYLDYKFKQKNNKMYDFVVDGVYYVRIGSGNVAVISRDETFNTYSGNVIIPENVTYNDTDYVVTSIAPLAFKYCSDLSCLVIPTSISDIASTAFDGCNIKSIVLNGNGEWSAGSLPNSVSDLLIGSGVTSVKGMSVNPSIIYSYSAIPPTCDEQSFIGYDAELHVPASSLAAYFIADYWCNFTNIVGDAVELEDITLDHDSVTLLKDNTIRLSATVYPMNATPKDIKWDSSDKSVAIVDDNGTVTPVEVGECDIVVTCAGKKAICHVIISEIMPISITLNMESVTLDVGSHTSLIATVSPEDATNKTVNWTSTDNTIAIVDSLGNVTAVSPGVCDIIASCRDLQAVCHVIVKSTIYIVLDQHELHVLPNHIQILTPTITPSSTEIVVTSSNPAIAAARLANGKIQIVGIKEGTSTVVVNSSDGLAYSDSCKVIVYTERGDVNSDGFVNITDVTYLISYLLDNSGIDYVGSKSDVNNDGELNITDITILISYVLNGSWPTGYHKVSLPGINIEEVGDFFNNSITTMQIGASEYLLEQ